MKLLIQDRQGNYHIADYCSYGNKYCVCGMVYMKGEIVNTFSLNQAVSIFCSVCYESIEVNDRMNREYNLRNAFGHLESGLRHKYGLIQMRILDTANKFSRMTVRFWPKLVKIKFQSKRK
jgi:hypothetical protein